MSRLPLSALVTLTLSIFFSSNVTAHDTRPLAVHVKEVGEGVFSVFWQAPPSVNNDQAPVVTLRSCKELTGAPSDGRLMGQSIFSCNDAATAPAINIQYPLYNPALSAVIQMKTRRGETYVQVLEPSIRVWPLPKDKHRIEVAAQYLSIGVHHVWTGLDHLLFLAGLLYIARTPKRILITVSAFTLAHSITIFLVALDKVHLSVAAVEAVIALSIVMLAAEIVRDGPRHGLIWRRPFLAAGAFGLVHGAGFASSLGEIGLPTMFQVAALLSFNLGVEFGQVAIIIAICAFSATGRWATPRMRSVAGARMTTLVFGYGLGFISCYWWIDRTVAALL